MDELLKYMFDICSYEPQDYLEYINYLIETNKLHDYIKTIKLNSIHTGMYIPNESKLLLNINRIIRKAKFMHWSNDKFSRIDPERFVVLQILFVINHEMYHPYQTMLADEPINDTLHKIVREGIELGRRSPKRLHLKERVLYNMFYHKVLTERSAEINAAAELIQLGKKDLLRASELRYIANYYDKLVQMGYENCKCPCKTYYKLRNKEEEFNQLDFNDREYTDLERLSWGFPMPSDYINDREKIELVLK